MFRFFESVLSMLVLFIVLAVIIGTVLFTSFGWFVLFAGIVVGVLMLVTRDKV